MGQGSHESDPIYVLCDLHGQLVAPLCCNDANANHCTKKRIFYATPTCRNDFSQSVAKLLLFTYGRCHLGSRDRPPTGVIVAGLCSLVQQYCLVFLKENRLVGELRFLVKPGKN